MMTAHTIIILSAAFAVGLTGLIMWLLLPRKGRSSPKPSSDNPSRTNLDDDNE